MSTLTLGDAKRALERVRAEKLATDPRNPVQRRRLLREYSAKDTDPSPSTDTADATADPVQVDHGDRRDVRMAPPSFDVTRDNFPKVFVECGCGECPSIVDPLNDPERNAFADVWRDRLESLWAQDVCPDPRPVTLRRAREAYLRFQRADQNAPDKTSLCEKTRAKHGKLLGAERELYEQEFGTDATVILFSLRQSPVEYTEDGVRQWVTPIELDHDLHKSWDNVRSTLDYQLDDKLGLEYEYVAVTTTTTIAATPHTHLVVVVEDPDDAVSIDVAQSVVDSHVNNAPRAYEEHHPVEVGQRDAGIIQHNPAVSTYPAHLYDGNAGERRVKTAQAITQQQDQFTIPNSRAMEYAAVQRPHWVLANVYDGTTDIHRDSVLVDGAAVAWARQHNWIKSSDGLDLQNGTVDR